ncbi:hypothetical protein ILYODFUR_031556 [Ilyodon furcidens]|uniref:Uncharacterized protein n=1 Tax=Ilyodon furcidens TaxID=33524 RepID=A0ABV0TG57_9TELE
MLGGVTLSKSIEHALDLKMKKGLPLKKMVSGKKDGVRIRTALVELIYIPGISNLMLLEEGLNLSPLDFDQIYSTCLSTLKYSPPQGWKGRNLFIIFNTP